MVTPKPGHDNNSHQPLHLTNHVTWLLASVSRFSFNEHYKSYVWHNAHCLEFFFHYHVVLFSMCILCFVTMVHDFFYIHICAVCIVGLPFTIKVCTCICVRIHSMTVATPTYLLKYVKKLRTFASWSAPAHSSIMKYTLQAPSASSRECQKMRHKAGISTTVITLISRFFPEGIRPDREGHIMSHW